MNELAPDPGERLVDNKFVADRLDVHPETVMDLVNRNHFPAPIMVGRLKRWRLKDIDCWIASRGAAKEQLDAMATKYVQPQKRKVKGA